MYYYDFQVVLQEVPGEISLCFSISGCTLRCKGCHSPYLWKEETGYLLSEEYFENVLNQYSSLATCVLFMGGEWHEKELVSFLKFAKHKKYKTCLYTGEDGVPDSIMKELTWIKTGKWINSFGGLKNEMTNQKFINIKTNKILNYLFSKN